MDSINSMIEAAGKWRNLNQEYDRGIVLIWQGAVYGWKDSLRDPSHEKPGAYAVNLDGQVFVAEGGNEYDGAERWSLVSD